MDDNGNGNGNGNDHGRYSFNEGSGAFLRRLERSFDSQEREFQKTRDDVNSLKGSQVVIQRDIADLASTVRALISKMDERAKPNLAAIALAVTIFIAAVPGGWFVMSTYVGAATSPISSTTAINSTNIQHVADALRAVETQANNSQTSDTNSRADRDQLNNRMRLLESSFNAEVADRRAGTAAVKVSLAEIETQIRAVCNIANLRGAQQERLNSMVWERAFNGNRYPNSTFFTPCATTNGEDVNKAPS